MARNRDSNKKYIDDSIEDYIEDSIEDSTEDSMETDLYSTEAIRDLLEIERDHLGRNATYGGFYSGNCSQCLPPNNDCPALVKARESASRETRVTVALILNGWVEVGSDVEYKNENTTEQSVAENGEPQVELIPYSNEAVATLLKIEQGHSYTKPDGVTPQSGACWDCWKLENGEPCPTLMKARASASRETKIAVGLLLKDRD